MGYRPWQLPRNYIPTSFSYDRSGHLTVKPSFRVVDTEDNTTRELDMPIVPFPFNAQAFARRRWLAMELEEAWDDLEAFGVNPARIRTLEQLGMVLAWLDAKAYAQALVEQREDPAEIVREALGCCGESWSNEVRS